MRRISLIAVALVGLVVMAATPGAVDNVLRYMKGGFQVGPNATLARTQNKVTAMLTADVDYDFAEVDGGCLDSPAVTVTGAKKGDPCFVGIGPADGGNQMVTSNATFSCYASASNAAKLRFCASIAGAGYTVDPVDAGYQLRLISSW